MGHITMWKWTTCSPVVSQGTPPCNGWTRFDTWRRPWPCRGGTRFATGDHDFGYYDPLPSFWAHAALQKCAAMAEEHGADLENVSMAQPVVAEKVASPFTEAAAVAIADLDEGAWPGLLKPAS